MTKVILLATIAALPLLSASPACAQAAISEPGLYSFYHPEGDLLGVGARRFHPGAGAPSANATSALAAPTPRGSRIHRRAARPAT
jgi:hypothetical protein